jgi:hypothetical protein
MSVFLMSSIAALAYIGVFDIHNFTAMPYFIKINAFAVVFIALFFLLFLLLNLKRYSKRKKAAAAAAAAAVAGLADVTRHQGGLLAAASRLSETSGQDVIYEENGVPYINSELAGKDSQGTLNRNFIKLVESVTGRSPLPPPVPRQQDKPEKAHKSGQG